MLYFSALHRIYQPVGSGFLGHAASKGCSRCLKSFPTDGFGQKTDFSGFDRDMWPQRTVEEHRHRHNYEDVITTLASRHALEREHGVRFSELLRIPYFDTVRSVVVDPMHNMFLGTAKRMVTIWKDNGLLNLITFKLVLINLLRRQILVEFHIKLHHNSVVLLQTNKRTGL